MKKLVHDPVCLLGLDEVKPSPENVLLYHPVTPDDPATIELADSIAQRGILEPLVVSADGYIISGHRRHCAGRISGLEELPCRKLNVRRGDGEKASDEFLRLLREHNRQRIKSNDELLREAIVSVDPKKAHRALTAYRKRKAKLKVAPMEIRDAERRCEISEAKTEFLGAVHKIIREQKEFWPLSLRQIHYQLLNDPPLIHSSKPGSRYRNDKPSYRRLVDLVTRARHEGWIDYDVIDDPFRFVTTWDPHPNLSNYYQQQVEDLLRDYSRDLLQSQPNQIELVVEKDTLRNIVSPVAIEFRIPLIIGRGQCSTRPLYNMAERYRKSGKTKLVILAVSDLDPDGDAIAHSLGQRLRDDFRIRDVAVIKTALTMEQVGDLALPEKFERAKEASPNYSRYVNTYHTDLVWELEAVDPKALQKLITDAIDAVIDRKAYNAEVKQERADAAHNEAVRQLVLQTLRKQTGS
jgi:hypothetical protein